MVEVRRALRSKGWAWLVATLLIGASALLGACNSGNSTDDFATGADQVCADYTAQRAKLFEQAAALDIRAARRKQADGRAAANRNAVTELRELDPPGDKRDAFERYIKQREAITALFTQLAPVRDDDKADALGRRISKEGREAEQLAEKVGLRDCAANALSSADRKQIKRLMTHTGTTTDPAVCSNLSTPGYVKLNWKTRAKCEEDLGEVAGSLDISELRGTRNLATMLIKARGKDVGAEGVTILGRVVRLGGEWRIQVTPFLEPKEPVVPFSATIS